MNIDQVASIINQAFEDLITHPPPETKYFKNRKVIRVEYGFNTGTIPVKLLIPSDECLDLWNKLDEDFFQQISFQTIQPRLNKNTSQATITALRKYAQEWPDHFLGDFYSCLKAAIFEHPKYPARKRKKQGRSPYDLTDDERIEVINTSRHLYVYIRHNQKKPINQQPIPLNNLYKAFDIGMEYQRNAIEATQKIIDDYFGLGIEDFRFAKTFIYCMPLEHLNKSEHIKAGNSPYLEPIFAEIKA